MRTAQNAEEKLHILMEFVRYASMTRRQMMRSIGPNDRTQIKALELVAVRVVDIAVESSKALGRDQSRAAEDAVIALGTFLSVTDHENTNTVKLMCARVVRSKIIRAYGKSTLLNATGDRLEFNR